VSYKLKYNMLIYRKISPILVDSIVCSDLKILMSSDNPIHSSLYNPPNWQKLGCPLFGVHSTNYHFVANLILYWSRKCNKD